MTNRKVNRMGLDKNYRLIDADKITHLRDVKAILKGMRLKVEVDSEEYESVKHLLKEESK